MNMVEMKNGYIRVLLPPLLLLFKTTWNQMKEISRKTIGKAKKNGGEIISKKNLFSYIVLYRVCVGRSILVYFDLIVHISWKIFIFGRFALVKWPQAFIKLKSMEQLGCFNRNIILVFIIRFNAFLIDYSSSLFCTERPYRVPSTKRERNRIWFQWKELFDQSVNWIDSLN